MHTLVGDSLYDQEEAFAMQLEFDWDLHSCFPRGTGSKALPLSRARACPPAATVSLTARRSRGSPRPTGTLITASRVGERARGRCAHSLALADQRAELQARRPRARVTTRACTPSTPRAGDGRSLIGDSSADWIISLACT